MQSLTPFLKVKKILPFWLGLIFGAPPTQQMSRIGQNIHCCHLSLGLSKVSFKGPHIYMMSRYVVYLPMFIQCACTVEYLYLHTTSKHKLTGVVFCMWMGRQLYKNQKKNLQLKKGQGHVQNETGISFQFGVGMMRGFREKSLDDGTSRNVRCIGI